MNLPTLYSKRENGGLQEWTIEVVDNKMRTHSGMVGGKIMTSIWTTHKGKNIGKSNETSDAEQALLEAQSKWDHHVERGYSEDPKKAGITAFFEPMLAQKFKDCEKKVKYPIFVQPKLDGIRAICTKDGIFSRNGKPFPSLAFIRASLQPIFDEHPDLVIDGEGYADCLKDNFNKITSIIKKQKPTTDMLEDAEKYIRYHVYDCYLGGKEIFSVRSEFINKLLGTTEKEDTVLEVLGLKYISLVKTFTVNNREELDKMYEKFLEEGYEGIMLRMDAPYENRRTESLLKMKPFTDAEYTILGVFEGEGNRSGTAGYMTFEVNGRSFRSNIKGYYTDSLDGTPKKGLDLREVWKDRATLIGKKATIKYNILSEYGIPRFPFVTSIRDYE